MSRIAKAAAAWVAVMMVSAAWAQPSLEAVLVPPYPLPGRAGAPFGPRPEGLPERSAAPLAEPPRAAPLLFGAAATESSWALPMSAVPRGAFTVEVMVLDHVNTPVGVAVQLSGGSVEHRHGDATHAHGGAEGAVFTLAYWDHRVRASSARGPFESGDRAVEASAPRFKQRWTHLVLTFDGEAMTLYGNGEPLGRASAGLDASGVAFTSLDIHAYLGNEPYMELANVLHAVRVDPAALTDAEAAERFGVAAARVEEGRLFDGFHFSKPPALMPPTTAAIGVVWETDRPASGVLEWGPTEDGIGRDGRRVELAAGRADARLGEAVMDGLSPGTACFYRVTAVDAEHPDRSITTGTLTCQTARGPGEPTVFAVIGDTESRPHVNAQLARLVWDERPDFVVNVGDLTDGGQTEQRFEWTHEYFVGVGSLAARVPMVPVPGNGESDLRWYRRYHALPEPESWYTFTHGDCAFFMLDSNRAETDFAEGGVQREWLERALAASTARWKIVAHHHATYSPDEDDYGDSWRGESSLGDPGVRRLVDVYERFGVDLVLFGHLHTYARSFPMRGGRVVADGDGPVHVQAGGGGGHLEDFTPTRPVFKSASHRGHHYLIAEVNGGTLRLRTHDDEGRMIDAYTVTKE